MTLKLPDLGIANVATGLVLIYALVGAALVIVSAVNNGIDPNIRLTFEDYLSQMAIAVGGLAVGRGLNAGLSKRVPS